MHLWGAITTLNTMLSEVLGQFPDLLEVMKSKEFTDKLSNKILDKLNDRFPGAVDYVNVKAVLNDTEGEE